jgi:hypothetical protein
VGDHLGIPPVVCFCPFVLSLSDQEFLRLLAQLLVGVGKILPHESPDTIQPVLARRIHTIQTYVILVQVLVTFADISQVEARS